MATVGILPSTMDQNNLPAWGSYLYQNFLLPAFSPNIASQWLTSPFASNAQDHNNNNGNGNGGLQQQQQDSGAGYSNNGDNNGAQNLGVPGDYFGSSWQIKAEPGLELSPPPMQTTQSFQTQPPTYSQSLLPHQQLQSQQGQQQQQPFNQQQWASYFGASIPTSLLTGNQPSSQQQVYGDQKVASLPLTKPYLDTVPSHASGSGSRASGSAKISPNSVEVIDELVASPSPILSSRNSPHHSPKKGKRRALSMDSNEDHYADEQDHEVPEGVERDGMIWGMRVEDYRALSARERKRVRNRISARTFRAKRKEHLNSLESTLSGKDMQIKLARDDAERLRREVDNLKRRLSKYEKI